LNWGIGRFAHHWLVVHAAVVERHGKALLMPAPPGSGKSTLCAALAFGKWRLFSDEFGIADLSSATVVPVPRPLALKGRSIDLLARRVGSLRFGPELEDTEGAPFRHVAPPASAVQRAAEPATPAWIVVPTYREGAATTLEPVARGRMLGHLADSTFNYNIVGDAGFARLAEIVDRCGCFALTYSNLDEAVDLCDRLAAPASLAR
jgi:HprK-related kinase A